MIMVEIFVNLKINFFVLLKGNFTEYDDLDDFESKNGEQSSFLTTEKKNVFQELNFNNFEEIFFNSSLKNARPIDY